MKKPTDSEEKKPKKKNASSVRKKKASRPIRQPMEPKQLQKRTKKLCLTLIGWRSSWNKRSQRTTPRK